MASRNTPERFLSVSELHAAATTALVENVAVEASLSLTSSAIAKKHRQANLFGRLSLSVISKPLDKDENNETLGDEAANVENAIWRVGIGMWVD